VPALEPPPASRFGTRIRGEAALDAPLQPGNVAATAENALVRFDVSGEEPREEERYPTVRQPNTVAGRDGELQIIDP
jgi:hypothetical protein